MMALILGRWYCDLLVSLQIKGKTTVSLVIADLFGCGHVQNDNITKKRAGGKAFNEAVIKELTDHDIVIADRNNHLRRLRGDLTTAVKEAFPDCRVVCFYWDVTQEPSPRVVEGTRKRVMDRGENHQSLTPGRNPQFDKVIRAFVNDFQPLDSNFCEDSLIDEVVQFSVTDTLRQNARVAINAVAEFCGLPVPPASRVEEALAKATTDYRPTVVKNVKNNKRRQENWRYYGLVVRENEVKTLVDRCLSGNAVPPAVPDQWRSSTMVETPHVTLVHKKSLAGQAQGEKIWSLCKAKVESSDEPVRCQFMVSRLLRTRDVLVLEVVPGSFEPAWIECASSYPHVTVAVGGGLSPYEGFAATKRYRDATEEMVRHTAQPEKAQLRERGRTERSLGDDAAGNAAARTSSAADLDVEAYPISPDGQPVAMEGILRGLY
ncbi:MAG: tRNA ligase kinase domain-containing protein [Olpidium bornovanus]|uniref:tRNA ligase kinase domain-containing protein n=1 Tax=Olpidium bornovanus TaxID=278681 RepID=A0A8H8A0E0_9FUNG|nr:MAG: tRNA ligase kinase domain-containing protein [Olpidium bornovanus]